MDTRIKPLKKRGFRLSQQDIVFSVIAYALFGLFTFVCIYPFWYLFINTISSNDLVKSGAVIIIPEGIHLQNYLDVFRRVLVPVADDYRPGLVIVSAGYDPAEGDPLGDMEMTPAGYSANQNFFGIGSQTLATYTVNRWLWGKKIPDIDFD